MSGVVIGVGAVVGGIAGGGSSIHSMRKHNKNQVKAFKKQMQYLQMNYNYNQAQLDRQEKSIYDSTMTELFSLELNAAQNNAQVEAALGETGTEGRNSEKIMQVAEGQTTRQETAIKEAYEGSVWDVRSQKQSLYLQTKATVDQAKDEFRTKLIGGMPAFMNFMDATAKGAALGAATAGAASAAMGALGGSSSSLMSTAANQGAQEMAKQGVNAAMNSAAQNAATTSLSTTAASTATGSGSSSLASSFGSGSTWLSRFDAIYTSKYAPYINMINKISDQFSKVSSNYRRGYYYY